MNFSASSTFVALLMVSGGEVTVECMQLITLSGTPKPIDFYYGFIFFSGYLALLPIYQFLNHDCQTITTAFVFTSNIVNGNLRMVVKSQQNADC